VAAVERLPSGVLPFQRSLAGQSAARARGAHRAAVARDRGLAAVRRWARHANERRRVTLNAFRPYALCTAGLGALTVSAFNINAVIGWGVLGMAFLVLEWRANPDRRAG